MQNPESILILVIIIFVIGPVLFLRLRYMKRSIEAKESMAQSLSKIAEAQSKGKN